MAAGLAAVATGCGQEAPDLVNGKALFVENCGNCHTLARAGTTTTQGPNLDEAFGPARGDGLGEQTVLGVVQEQIANVRASSTMPEDLVTGGDARDVAAYVAQSAGVPGDDTGALASAGLAGATDPEQIFTAAGCGGCHTFAAAGTNASVGPSLDELASADPASIEQSIVDPDAEIAQGFSAGTMPSTYGDQLEEEQLQTLVEYLMNPEGG